MVHIRARPQTNGNTRRDFAEAYKALVDAKRAVQDAAANVLSNVANGQNYQHLGVHADAAMNADRRNIQEHMLQATALIASIGFAIAEICDKHDRGVAW